MVFLFISFLQFIIIILFTSCIDQWLSTSFYYNFYKVNSIFIQNSLSKALPWSILQKKREAAGAMPVNQLLYHLLYHQSKKLTGSKFIRAAPLQRFKLESIFIYFVQSKLVTKLCLIYHLYYPWTRDLICLNFSLFIWTWKQHGYFSHKIIVRTHALIGYYIEIHRNYFPVSMTAVFVAAFIIYCVNSNSSDILIEFCGGKGVAWEKFIFYHLSSIIFI